MTASLTVGFVWPGPPESGDLEETRHFIPTGVKFHIVGTRSPGEPQPGGITLERLLAMPGRPNIEQTAKELLPREVKAISYGCTSASYIRGVGGDQDISDRITAATGLPASTTSSSVVAALRHLGVSRVSVLSPHIDELNERLRRFLEDCGFDVVHMRGLNRLGGIEEIPQNDIRQLVLQIVDRPDADGVFISCTGMRTSVILDSLEQATGTPVVSALQATAWELLRLGGVTPDMSGVGMLFRRQVVESTIGHQRAGARQ